MFRPEIAAFILILSLTTEAIFASSTFAQKTSSEWWRQNSDAFNKSDRAEDISKCDIAGLEVAIWNPPKATKYPVPLVIFSHGNHGQNTQSIFIMKAIARAGYLVMAPEHQDAFHKPEGWRQPKVSFRDAAAWDESIFRDRGNDIKRLLSALHSDKRWKNKIDWSKIALAGHSLGGYTALSLAGAWPSWKLPEIKAVLAMSPYCLPLNIKGGLQKICIPVMYQGGTRDTAITPSIDGPHGAFIKTASPAYFVEFNGVGHFGWTNFNHNEKEQELINYYCVAFLNKFLRDDKLARPDLKQPGVSILKVK